MLMSMAQSHCPKRSMGMSSALISSIHAALLQYHSNVTFFPLCGTVGVLKSEVTEVGIRIPSRHHDCFNTKSWSFRIDHDWGYHDFPGRFQRRIMTGAVSPMTVVKPP